MQPAPSSPLLLRHQDGCPLLHLCYPGALRHPPVPVGSTSHPLLPDQNHPGGLSFPTKLTFSSCTQPSASAASNVRRHAVCWPRCPAHQAGANPCRYHQQTARGKIIRDNKFQNNVAKSTVRAVTSLLCAAPRPLGNMVGGQTPLRAPAASSLPSPAPVGSGSISSRRLGFTLPRCSRW